MNGRAFFLSRFDANYISSSPQRREIQPAHGLGTGKIPVRMFRSCSEQRVHAKRTSNTALRRTHYPITCLSRFCRREQNVWWVQEERCERLERLCTSTFHASPGHRVDQTKSTIQNALHCCVVLPPAIMKIKRCCCCNVDMSHTLRAVPRLFQGCWLQWVVYLSAGCCFIFVGCVPCSVRGRLLWLLLCGPAEYPRRSVWACDDCCVLEKLSKKPVTAAAKQRGLWVKKLSYDATTAFVFRAFLLLSTPS